jgi:hypothetical protein
MKEEDDEKDEEEKKDEDLRGKMKNKTKDIKT